jgi:hypothetical protein
VLLKTWVEKAEALRLLPEPGGFAPGSGAPVTLGGDGGDITITAGVSGPSGNGNANGGAVLIAGGDRGDLSANGGNVTIKAGFGGGFVILSSSNAQPALFVTEGNAATASGLVTFGNAVVQPAKTTSGTASTVGNQYAFQPDAGQANNTTTVATVTGGTAGNLNFAGAIGGSVTSSASATNVTGGTGSSVTFTTGNGGAASTTAGASTSHGGVGGSFTITAGNGGAATLATTTVGGNGGDITFNAGSGGAGTTPGSSGTVKLGVTSGEVLLGRTGGHVTITQEAWTAPTLLGTWTNVGGGNEVAGFFKDSMGVIHLKGVVTGGTINTAAFTLPVGYRPVNTQNFVADFNNAFGIIQVTNAGSVIPAVGSNLNCWMSGMTFDTR